MLSSRLNKIEQGWTSWDREDCVSKKKTNLPQGCLQWILWRITAANSWASPWGLINYFLKDSDHFFHLEPRWPLYIWAVSVGVAFIDREVRGPTPRGRYLRILPPIALKLSWGIFVKCLLHADLICCSEMVPPQNIETISQMLRTTGWREREDKWCVPGSGTRPGGCNKVRTCSSLGPVSPSGLFPGADLSKHVH